MKSVEDRWSRGASKTARRDRRDRRVGRGDDGALC